MLHADNEPAQQLPANTPPTQRFDAAFQQKVIQLALKLEGEHQETVTAEQLVAAASEVGISPSFIHEAIAALSAERPVTSVYPPLKRGVKRGEFRRALGALAAPLLWASVTYALHSWPDAMTFCAYIVPAPLAVILGFITRKRKLGALAGATLGLSIAPSVGIFSVSSVGVDVTYAMIAGLICGVAGQVGARAGEEYAEPDSTAESAPSMSRQQVIEQLQHLQQAYIAIPALPSDPLSSRPRRREHRRS